MTANNIHNPAPTPASAASIGKWLLQRIEEAAPHHVYQSQAVNDIRNKFGAEWSYQNKNGNWAISKEVLKEFRKLKYPAVQWAKGSQAWHIVTAEQLEYIEKQAALQKQRREEISKRGTNS